MELFKSYEKDGFLIREYSRDGGKTICHKTEEILPDENDISPESVEFIPEPSIEEKILAETQYQTMLLEMNTVGGN